VLSPLRRSWACDLCMLSSSWIEAEAGAMLFRGGRPRAPQFMFFMLHGQAQQFFFWFSPRAGGYVEEGLP
jgi:hypothetical protein